MALELETTTPIYSLSGQPTGEIRPFLKWAGGKRQLLPQLSERFPEGLYTGKIDRYAEPFVGGGALFFHLATRFPIRQAYLADINREVVLAYRTVQQAVEPLIALLGRIERTYLRLPVAEREHYFYETRVAFNESRHGMRWESMGKTAVRRTAQLIFLNRTGYNGLFRVNSKGKYNVPFGRYKNPTICHTGRLRGASALLRHAIIRHADYTDCIDFVSANSFVYFDPPYRPLSKTSNFNSYSAHRFDDDEQARLANFYRQLSDSGASLMLSNSDPHNVDLADDFFVELYAGFEMSKVQARRGINRNGRKRGKVSELLITNY